MKTAKEFLIEKGVVFEGELAIDYGDGKDSTGEMVIRYWNRQFHLSELLEEFLKVNTSPGLQLIAAERQRVVEEEGFTPEQDENYTEGQLAMAAAAYAIPENCDNPHVSERAEVFWPWPMAYWRPTPKNRIKELVKAGGLIVAEIERLKRLGNG